MDAGTAGLVGGLVGSAIGVIGGLIGTYFSIKNTDSHAERTFVMRAAICMWIGITVFVALLMLLPRPYNWLMWIPYGLALGSGIRYVNRRQMEIRAREPALPVPHSN